MAKDDQSNSWNFRSHRCKSDSNNQPKVNCVLRFKDPKPSDESIKTNHRSHGSEVSEVICGFKTGDAEANLVALMNRIINLGDLYEMWRRKVKKASSDDVSSTRRPSQRWLVRMNKRSRGLESTSKRKRSFQWLLQKLGQATFGPKAYIQQRKVMENGDIKISESNPCNGTYRLIQINRMMPFLGIQTEDFFGLLRTYAFF